MASEDPKQKDKLLKHIRSLVVDLETYCDRDEPLSKECIQEGLQGLKNTIDLGLDD